MTNDSPGIFKRIDPAAWCLAQAATIAILLLLVAEASAQTNQSGASRLAEQLQTDSAEDLARAAREHGDARRGAILFHQAHLGCTKCHSTGQDDQPRPGPDLTRLGKEIADRDLVESILDPSKVIRKGFETTVVLTLDGKTFTGVVSELSTADELILQHASGDGSSITIAHEDIEQRSVQKASIMPTGLVDQLAGRGQFLDLARYVIEIARQGPSRAAELRPPASMFATAAVPEYEGDIDHAGFIADWDAASLKRGKAVYNRVCVNCHGTKNRPGSLPTSRRFGTETFKAGSDPYSLYRTLTHGFGMMVPQSWMVPEQKYDVIHYLREQYLKDTGQYSTIDRPYLAGLPSGSSRGPEPGELEPWVTMDYGPSLIASYEVGRGKANFAYKGIAVRLDSGPGGVSRGKYWMLFDHDTLRMAAAWSGQGFMDFNSIMFNGRHEVHPRLVGQLSIANPVMPGWGSPQGGRFDDPRLRGRDRRAYGPLPADWGRYKGLYHYGDRVIVSYRLGQADVLEMPGLEAESPRPVFSRTFHIGPRKSEMLLQVAHGSDRTASLQTSPAGVDGAGEIARFGESERPENADRVESLVAGLLPAVPDARWLSDDQGNLRLRIPAGAEPLLFTLWMTQHVSAAELQDVVQALTRDHRVLDLTMLTRGGPPRWAPALATRGIAGSEDGPFAIDVLSHPRTNPWLSRIRPTGLDFFADGKRLAVCCWDGDVWLVDGIDSAQLKLSWRRIASGLFQPLGLKIVDGRIFVNCRDQIVILHDSNGDGETDFYENFNSDHQVTEHFHEFAMGLQTDAAGNFYYAKSARHALPALVPHHGTLLRVSPDGSKTDILATGLRAANGVCVNPDGTFIVTDQEGHWNPKNRINWITPGGFYGNMYGYHDVTDTSDAAMQQPLCWITNRFDRSPAELLWVDSARWGPLAGSLLNLSYGYGQIFVVPHEELNGQMQGGMCALPIPKFPTGLVRGRFHPGDGHLYACGMFAWAGAQQQPGGLYRVRYTGKPVHLPVGLKARRGRMEITFSGKLDKQSASQAGNFRVKVWSIERTEEYGSDHYDERRWQVAAARLADDGRTVSLEIPEIEPTRCMEIRYNLRGDAGEAVSGVIHNTIHHLGP